MEDLVKRKHIEEVRRNLKQTMHLAGAVRDRDIAIKLVRRVGTSQRLQNLLHCQRATAQKELVDVLQTGSTTRWSRAGLNNWPRP